MDNASRPKHHDGRGFRNPNGVTHADVPVWTMAGFFGRRIVSSLSRDRNGAPPRVANDGAVLRSRRPGDAPLVTWIGHSTLLVQMGTVSFLTDPTWSYTASPTAFGPKRYVAPGLRMRDLPEVDFAVVSHNHYDHMDAVTLARLARRGVRIFVPLANAYLLRDAGVAATELDWWDSAEVTGARITAVPAQHWSRRGLFDGNRSLWAGWFVETDGRTFYFAGDTGKFEGFREIRQRLGAPDLAALPIGAYRPESIMRPSHLDPEEAVEAAAELGARRTVAVHFGTFDLSDEPIEEPPQRFRAASKAAGRGTSVDWVLAIGETRAW